MLVQSRDPEQDFVEEPRRGQWGYPGQTQSSFTNINRMLSRAEGQWGEGPSLQDHFKLSSPSTGWWHRLCSQATVGKGEQEVVRKVESKPYESTGWLPLAFSAFLCFSTSNLSLQLNLSLFYRVCRNKQNKGWACDLDRSERPLSLSTLCFSSNPEMTRLNPVLGHLVERVLILHSSGPAGSISIMVIVRCTTRGLQQAFRAVAAAL